MKKKKKLILIISPSLKQKKELNLINYETHLNVLKQSQKSPTTFKNSDLHHSLSSKMNNFYQYVELMFRFFIFPALSENVSKMKNFFPSKLP